jgi:hypothetical protein
VGTIAGCRVLDGVIRRDAEIKVMRGDEQVFKGKIGSLKRFKDDAREVTNGMECGIGIANFSDSEGRRFARSLLDGEDGGGSGGADFGEGHFRTSPKSSKVASWLFENATPALRASPSNS